MFKIILLSMSPDDTIWDGHSLEMLSEKFSNQQEAKDFIIGTLIQEDKKDYLGDNEELAEDTEFLAEDYGAEVIYEVSSHGDLVYRNEYKIVEVE